MNPTEPELCSEICLFIMQSAGHVETLSESCLSIWIRSWKRSRHPVRCVDSVRSCFIMFVWHSHCGRPQRQPHGGLRSSLHHFNIPQPRKLAKLGITKFPKLKSLYCFCFPASLPSKGSQRRAPRDHNAQMVPVIYGHAERRWLHLAPKILPAISTSHRAGLSLAAVRTAGGLGYTKSVWNKSKAKQITLHGEKLKCLLLLYKF